MRSKQGSGPKGGALLSLTEALLRANQHWQLQVVSDSCVTGMAIIRAIMAGERDPLLELQLHGTCRVAQLAPFPSPLMPV